MTKMQGTWYTNHQKCTFMYEGERKPCAKAGRGALQYIPMHFVSPATEPSQLFSLRALSPRLHLATFTATYRNGLMRNMIYRAGGSLSRLTDARILSYSDWQHEVLLFR